MRLRPIVGFPILSSPIMNWIAGFVTEIDFDTVTSGTVVNNKYSGVTLSSTNAGDVFASNAFGGAETQPNVVTLAKPPQLPGFDDRAGGIQATFDVPQLFVSIDARPIVDNEEHFKPLPDTTPYMTVFGMPILLPGGHKFVPVLAVVNFPLGNMDPNYQSWQTIDYVSTSPTPNISGIAFSSKNSGVGSPVYAMFDRLRFAHHLPLTATVVEG